LASLLKIQQAIGQSQAFTFCLLIFAFCLLIFISLTVAVTARDLHPLPYSLVAFAGQQAPESDEKSLPKTTGKLSRALSAGQRA